MKDQLIKKQEIRWSYQTKGKNVLNVCTRILFLMGFAGGLMSYASDAQANPTGGTVVGGSASISSAGKTLTVNQASQRALINWNTFDIAGDETTQFVQPNAQALAINRVFTSGQVSKIDGALKANGQVIVINPNGVLIGNGAHVDTNGFVATTADLADNNIDGALNFSKAGKAGAKVVNNGTITAGEAGLVGLVAPEVENNGVIVASINKVQLGAADTFGLDLYGDGLINLAVKDSKALKVSNKGSIEGAQVLLTAASASNAVTSVINNTGVIRATSLVKGQNGEIILKANGATTNVSGTLEAKNGFVETSGDIVNVADGTTIEAAEWLIDPNNVVIGSGSASGTSYISASSVLNSLQNNTNVTIQTTGTGGSKPGDITVNSALTLADGTTTTYPQLSVNANTWYKVTASGIVTPSGFEVYNPSFYGYTYTGAATHVNDTFHPNTVTTSYNSTLTLDTSGTTNGAVTIAAAVSATGDSTLGLTVNAAGNVDVNAAVTTNGAAVNLTSNKGYVNSSTSGDISTKGGNVTVNAKTGSSLQGDIAAAGGNILISALNAAVKLAKVTTTGAGDITVNGASIGTNGSANLDLEAGDELTLNANVSTANNITLKSGGNMDLDGVAINDTTAGLSTLVITAGGTLTGSGDITVSNSDNNASENYSQASASITADGNINVLGDVVVSSFDEDQPNFDSTSNLTLTSTGGSVSVKGIEVTAWQSKKDSSSGSNLTAIAHATVNAATGVTVTADGVKATATAKNTDKNYSTSADAQIAINGGNGDVDVTGDVAATSDVTAPNALSATVQPISTANVSISSTGGELYFTSAPTATAKNNQDSGDAQASEHYVGTDVNETDGKSTSYTTTQDITQNVGKNKYWKLSGGTLTVSDTQVYSYSATGQTTSSSNFWYIPGKNNSSQTSAFSYYGSQVFASNVKWYNTSNGQTSTNTNKPSGSNWKATTAAAQATQTATLTQCTTNGGCTIVTGTQSINNPVNSSTATLSLSGLHQLDVTADYKEKVYDNDASTDPALTYVTTTHYNDHFGGVWNLLQQTVDNATYTTGALTREPGQNADDYDILQGGVTAKSGLAGGSYAISYTGNIFRITKRNITVAGSTVAGDNTKVYGTNDTAIAYTVSNLVSGDEGLASGALSREHYGTYAGEQVGSYDVEQGSLSFGSNYNITDVTGTYTITKAPLTITAGSLTKTYGDTATLSYTVTPTGVLVHHNVDGLSWTDYVSSINLTSAGRVANADVGGGTNPDGSYVVTASNAKFKTQGHNELTNVTGNYDVTYVAGALTVTQKILSLKDLLALAYDKVYDDTTDADGNVVLLGKVWGDNVWVDYDTASFADQNAGYNKLVTFSGLTLEGNDKGNYSLGNISTATDRANIYKATLVLGGSYDSKVYDATNVSDATPWYTGLKGDDTISPLSQHFDSKNAGLRLTLVNGGYTVNDGNNGGNYNVIVLPGLGYIDRALLTVTADPQSKVRGTTDPTLTAQTTGFVGGEDFDFDAFLSRLPGEAVGQYEIQLGNLGWSRWFGTLGNYNINYVNNYLTITAPNQTGPYLQIAGLNRPVLSVADEAVNYSAPFEAVETGGMNVDVSIRGNSGATSLASLEPAAGDADEGQKKKAKKGIVASLIQKGKQIIAGKSPADLAKLEPAAGGPVRGVAVPAANGNFALANDFLDGKVSY